MSSSIRARHYYPFEHNLFGGMLTVYEIYSLTYITQGWSKAVVPSRNHQMINAMCLNNKITTYKRCHKTNDYIRKHFDYFN